MPKAKAEALKAIELDPFDPAGHTALGGFLEDYEWDWEGARKEIQKAIDLQPSLEMAHHAMGWLSVNLGHSNDAVREFSKCIELNPVGGCTTRIWRSSSLTSGAGMRQRTIFKRLSRSSLIPQAFTGHWATHCWSSIGIRRVSRSSSEQKP